MFNVQLRQNHRDTIPLSHMSQRVSNTGTVYDEIIEVKFGNKEIKAMIKRNIQGS